MLYLAYGMNTNREEMQYRCPGARALGPARLLDHAFRFAVHADVVVSPGSYVDGVLWDITPECLAALDRLEGYPYYYNRAELEVEFEGHVFHAVTYFMLDGHEDSLPAQSYFDLVLEGYCDHGVPVDQLRNALVLLEDVVQ
jgi:gamma-glutamylcyclotransferase (GGCT)/AIG2-like uncharacterized protein YtfP